MPTLTDRLFDDADKADLDPFALFEEWFAEARASEPNDPHAMAVATVDAAGLPDVRMVLLNARDSRGFTFFTNFDSRKGEELIANLAEDLKQCPEPIQLRMVWHFWHCDQDYGKRVSAAAGIDLSKAKDLPPLPGKPAPGANRDTATYTSGKPEDATPADERATSK